jgi:membrane-bound lytic murein transglycosylase B
VRNVTSTSTRSDYVSSQSAIDDCRPTCDGGLYRARRVDPFSLKCRVRIVRESLGFLGVALLSLIASTHARADYLSRDEVRTFIDTMQSEHGIDAAETERVLGSARFQPTVFRLMGPEPVAPTKPVVRNYPAYRGKFLTKTRIAAGTRYWAMHEKQLSRAEIEFGVPAEVILGILGVETAYGQNTGSFRVVDALATIAFDGPRRQDYFREELKELLLLARDGGFDPLEIKGSYAGAMGLPQFMPSSIRRWAVDFDRDGKIDLANSPADAIGSIASYLSANGWTDNELATVTVKLPAGREKDFVSGLERAHQVDDLRKLGVKFSNGTLPDGACSVFELPTPGKAPRYVAGFANFGAITHYNRSTFYASAVLDLATAVRNARNAQLVAQAASERPRVHTSQAKAATDDHAGG